jgi:hypothetical protein
VCTHVGGKAQPDNRGEGSELGVFGNSAYEVAGEHAGTDLYELRDASTCFFAVLRHEKKTRMHGPFSSSSSSSSAAAAAAATTLQRVER